MERTRHEVACGPIAVVAHREKYFSHPGKFFSVEVPNLRAARRPIRVPVAGKTMLPLRFRGAHLPFQSTGARHMKRLGILSAIVFVAFASSGAVQAQQLYACVNNNSGEAKFVGQGATCK